MEAPLSIESATFNLGGQRNRIMCNDNRKTRNLTSLKACDVCGFGQKDVILRDYITYKDVQLQFLGSSVVSNFSSFMVDRWWHWNIIETKDMMLGIGNGLMFLLTFVGDFGNGEMGLVFQIQPYHLVVRSS